MDSFKLSKDGTNKIKDPAGEVEKHPVIVGLLVVVVLGTFGYILSSGSSGTSTASPSTETGSQQAVSDRETISTAYAESIIEQLLKSPSTAKFSNVQAYELSNETDVWAVNGYVDSENSFGAAIRSTWEVQLDYRDGKGGTVISVLFDGKKVQ